MRDKGAPECYSDPRVFHKDVTATTHFLNNSVYIYLSDIYE